MQLSTLTLSLLGLASTVLAQLPACPTTCFSDNYVNTACASTDIACLCGDSVFFYDVEICVLTTCSEDDITTTLTYATEQCAAVGVPIKRSVFGRKH